MILFLLWSAMKQTVALLKRGKVVRGAAVWAPGGRPCERKLSGMQACIHTPSVWINWLWKKRWKARSGRVQSGVPAERPTTLGEGHIEMWSEVHRLSLSLVLPSWPVESEEYYSEIKTLSPDFGQDLTAERDESKTCDREKKDVILQEEGMSVKRLGFCCC